MVYQSFFSGVFVDSGPALQKQKENTARNDLNDLREESPTRIYDNVLMNFFSKRPKMRNLFLHFLLPYSFICTRKRAGWLHGREKKDGDELGVCPSVYELLGFQLS